MRAVVALVAVAGLFVAAPSFAQEQVMFRAAGTVPFLKEAIAVHIDNRYAVTEHRQIVRNAIAGQSEGQYDLFTPPGAFVTKFVYWNGDEQVKGELLERADAAKMYDQVTRQRRDPGILEEVSPGRFHYRIFPFAPEEAKRVEVRWESYLPAHGRFVEYKTPVAKPNTSITIDIEGASGTNVTSETHEIEVEALPRGVRVKAIAPRGPTGQFVLRYELASRGASAFVHEDVGHEAYVVLDFPPIEQNGAPAAHDVTFVVDRSGSESADTLARTKNAVRDAIARLDRKRDRVNVIAFDETTSTLYPSPRDATDDVVREAQAFVAHIRDGAGTDLPRAIERAFQAQSSGADRDRIVVLVTDGQDDKAAVLAATDAGRRDVRIAALGIGETIDSDLLGRIASSRGAFFETAAAGDDASAHLSRIYERSTHPALLHAKLDITGAAGVQLAAPMPTTIPAGERVSVALRCRPRGVLSAKLVGDFGDGNPRVVSGVEVDLARATHRPWAASAWAKARIDNILASKGASMRDDALEIALSFEMTSPFTAFFAIPPAEAARIKTQIADARRRKRWLSQDPSETIVADATPMPAAQAPMKPAIVASAEEPQAQAKGGSSMTPPVMNTPAPAAPPSLERSHHGGCASCSTIGVSRGVDAIALAIAAGVFALAALRRRNRKNEGGAS
jgi:hypothetical protein